jgi:hypothetical protein
LWLETQAISLANPCGWPSAPDIVVVVERSPIETPHDGELFVAVFSGTVNTKMYNI